MSLVSDAEVLHIIQRSLNHVDARLVGHGERVAYLVLKLMEEAGKWNGRTTREVCIVALLHDIGAYKTEEIDRMVQFETQDVWHHAIYGYLFLKYLSPLNALSQAVLFHHMDYSVLKNLDTDCKEEAQLIHLADRLDIYLMNRGVPPPGVMDRYEGGRFSGEALALLHQAEAKTPKIYANLLDGSYRTELEARISTPDFREEEINGYLRMVVSAIDFRSYHTVTHTITTERISEALAKRMGLTVEEQYKIKYGSLVHDLGKIAIPVEILEFPGKLSPQDMLVMKTHVDITEEILGPSADEEMLHIAVRHHEKLDGSGYPRGLAGDVLTRSERILAVSDLVSALSGMRSYKNSFGKDRILSILTEQKARGLICPQVADAMLENYDVIMAEVEESCAPILAAYASIQDQFHALALRFIGLDKSGSMQK